MSRVPDNPEEVEGDDTVNDPEGVEKVAVVDLEDAPDLDDEDDEEDEFDSDTA